MPAFLPRSLALASAALTAGLVLPSCGPGESAARAPSSGAPAPTAAKVPAGSAARGRVIRIGDQARLLQDGEEALCDVHYCEPNYVYHAYFGSGSSSDKSEQEDYSRKMMNVPAAWEVTEGSRDVVVAVVDTGAQVDHPDLAANIWFNAKEKAGRAGVDDDGNGYIDDVYGWDFVNNRANAIDDNEHGTHCSGIIAAVHNGIGTVGVAPKVRVMPVKFMDATGSGTSLNAAAAIDYAVANGARIISNSWGGDGLSSVLADAIARAQAKGVIVLAAAGNDGTDNDQTPTYPAGYPGVIAVASTDENDWRSSFSNYGAASVLVAAPGSDIFSTVLGGKYDTLSGTSMATPQVAGALALGLSLDRGYTPAQLTQHLCDSAKAGKDYGVKCGRIDVAAFLKGL